MKLILEGWARFLKEAEEKPPEVSKVNLFPDLDRTEADPASSKQEYAWKANLFPTLEKVGGSFLHAFLKEYRKVFDIVKRASGNPHVETVINLLHDPNSPLKEKYFTDRYIGQGTYRAVYDLGNGLVIKIARQENGAKENKAECDPGNNIQKDLNKFDIGIKYYCDQENNYSFILAEKVEKMKRRHFRDFTKEFYSIYNSPSSDLPTPDWVKYGDLKTALNIDTMKKFKQRFNHEFNKLTSMSSKKVSSLPKQTIHPEISRSKWGKSTAALYHDMKPMNNFSTASEEMIALKKVQETFHRGVLGETFTTYANLAFGTWLELWLLDYRKTGQLNIKSSPVFFSLKQETKDFVVKLLEFAYGNQNVLLWDLREENMGISNGKYVIIDILTNSNSSFYNWFKMKLKSILPREAAQNPPVERQGAGGRSQWLSSKWSQQQRPPQGNIKTRKPDFKKHDFTP
jgi:hypothetical protein